MAIEIERKFLVKNNQFVEQSFKKETFIQGFLNSNKNRTVRIRIVNNSACLTIKGISNSEGTSRFEWEKQLTKNEGLDLLKLCEPGIIEKDRYYVTSGKHVFEIDVFKKENEGLIVAEIELAKADDFFEKPTWLGAEVTGKIKYYNSSLSKNPFRSWK